MNAGGEQQNEYLKVQAFSRMRTASLCSDILGHEFVVEGMERLRRSILALSAAAAALYLTSNLFTGLNLHELKVSKHLQKCTDAIGCIPGRSFVSLSKCNTMMQPSLHCHSEMRAKTTFHPPPT